MKLTDGLTRDEERQVVNALMAAINDRPDDWEFGHYVAADKKSGVKIWTCNGWAFVKIEDPVQAELRFLNKLVIWRALKRVYRARPATGRKFRAIMDALETVGAK